MRRATKYVKPGYWPAEAAGDYVTLAYDDRRRRRIRLRADSGTEFLLDLPEAVILPDGAGLRMEDGGWIGVRAAAEYVAVITTDLPSDLIQVAWHLGNRHLPTEVTPEALFIRQDHVIEDMVRRLGAQVTHLRRPFNPEGGAYGGHPTHGHEHDHEHEHGHGHGHGHDHGHGPEHGHSHSHSHEHHRAQQGGPSHSHTHEPAPSPRPAPGHSHSHTHAHKPVRKLTPTRPTHDPAAPESGAQGPGAQETGAQESGAGSAGGPEERP